MTTEPGGAGPSDRALLHRGSLGELRTYPGVRGRLLIAAREEHRQRWSTNFRSSAGIQTVSAEEVRSLVRDVGDVVAALRTAEASKKAELYASLGLLLV